MSDTSELLKVRIILCSILYGSLDHSLRAGEKNGCERDMRPLILFGALESDPWMECV